MKLIKRSNFLEHMKTMHNMLDIKIITGIRRSGKSKLLQAYVERIKQTDPQAT